jgi:hypothetical protein
MIPTAVKCLSFWSSRTVSRHWRQHRKLEDDEKEIDVKDFLILHYGFEKPTPEEMGEWNKWFESIAGRQVDRGHLPGGREFSHAGTKDLPFGRDSITGYTVIKADNLDEAAKIAQECPFVASTRVYEIRK